MDRPKRPLLTLKLKPQDQYQAAPPATPLPPAPIEIPRTEVPSVSTPSGTRRSKSNRIAPDIFRRAAAAAASAVESLLADAHWRDAALHAAYQATKPVAKPKHRVHAKLVATVAVRRLLEKDAAPEFVDRATRAAYAAAMTVVIEDPDPR